ncbi:MAG TPA: IS1595 family transposase, partial [Rhodothermales bacterium]|nr:IS1595 family transposase [Rhodothermales bacterium]
VRYFADEDVALAFLVNLRWPDGKQTCPACASKDEQYFLASRRVWKCRACKKQFSIKVGTIFEDSPIKLSKWLPAMWMLANCKNGISSYELGRAIGVTQKSAWFMLHRIRLAMQAKSFDKLDGEVELDETYIGGKARFMHKAKRERVIQGKTGGAGKTAVMGILKRGDGVKPSQVRAQVLKGNSGKVIKPIVRENVEEGSNLYTDSHGAYRGLGEHYTHETVDHAVEYVVGNVHTNGLENFWVLLKRALKGTYVSVEPFHLFRYLDEQTFRFNERKDTDRGRFLRAVSSIVGKRLNYSDLTGATLCRT